MSIEYYDASENKDFKYHLIAEGNKSLVWIIIIVVIVILLLVLRRAFK